MAEYVLIRGGESALSSQQWYNTATSYKIHFLEQKMSKQMLNIFMRNLWGRLWVTWIEGNTINLTLSPNQFISEICLQLTVDDAISYTTYLKLHVLKLITFVSGGVTIVDILNVFIINRLILSNITDIELLNQYLRHVQEDANNKLIVYLPLELFNTVGNLYLKMSSLQSVDLLIKHLKFNLCSIQWLPLMLQQTWMNPLEWFRIVM